jgi:acyl-CoA synthetase (NDP forming)
MTGAAEREGLSIPRFSDALAGTVAASSSPRAQTQNPVDLVDNLTVETAADVLDSVLASDEVDAALMNLHVFVHETAEAEAQVGRRLGATARRLAKPVVIASRDLQAAGPMAAARAGVPVFRDGETAARVMALLTRSAVTGRVASIPSANAPLPQGPLCARDLLVGAGLRFPEALFATDAGSAAHAAHALGAPLAVKVVGPLHKSDIGGVRLNLTAAEVPAAAQSLLTLPGATGVLIERMSSTSGAVEILAGVTWEPGLGPVLAVGMGGVLAEVLDDVALTLAPATKAEVLAALDRLRGSVLLHGYRGKPAVDLEALAEAIALLSRIGAAQPDLAVLEVNPFLAAPGGVVALDARAVRAGDQP